MKVVGFAGFSGSGKTTLVEQLIPELRKQGLRVSVVKHAHHRFDIDHPGKDSYRHREAGAFEVVIASDRRLALMREFEQTTRLSVHQMLAELDAAVDWVLVEGFKESDLPKIEIWRLPEPGAVPHPVRYGTDGCVVAVATDAPGDLPAPTVLPVFDLNAPVDIAAWLLVGEVWASIAPVGGREAARAGQIIASTETRIVIRWSARLADIHATWRIRRGDVIYNISRVVNGNLSNREIELTCESGVNDG